MQKNPYVETSNTKVKKVSAIAGDAYEKAKKVTN